MKKKISLLALPLSAMLIFTSCSSVIETPPETEPSETTAPDFSSIRPQDDFYGYVNAQHLYETDLNEMEGSAGAFAEINEMVDDQLDSIIDEIIAGDTGSYAPGSNEQLISALYYQALEATTGGDLTTDSDIESLKDLISQIRGTKTVDEYLEVCGVLYKNWKVSPIFGGDISSDLSNSSSGSIKLYPFSAPSGMSLSDLVLGGYYAQSLATTIRTALINFGEDPDKAQDKSIEDAELIIRIADGSDLELIKLISEDWAESMNKAIFLTDDEIDELCPNLGSTGIARTFGLEENPAGGYYIWDKEQLITLDSLLTEENLGMWQDIAITDLVQTVGQYLPSEYGGQESFYSNDLYARQIVKYFLSQELGEEYAERYLDEQTIADVTKIAEDITDEYIVLINDCEWLSDEGKQAITAKLNNMEYFIGADEPHVTDPADKDLIGHSVFQTLLFLNIRDYEKTIDELYNGMERNGFNGMAPQTVNACYMPDINSVNITLAIINAPFYSPDQTYYQNLGGIGSVIGHEISHAFDNDGMLFDMYGNYNPGWIPEADREAFDQMAARVEEYYSNQTILDIHPVDGELTLGENLADISGVECILNLADTNDQKKEVLENYARVWSAVHTRDDALSYLYLDVHSPDMIRANAVVSLFDCFYEIYDVHEGDLMYVAPEDRVTRW